MGCIYCEGRSSCKNNGYGFEDIEVKQNSSVILEAELKEKGNKVIIQTGDISDPYMPLEKDLCNTRKALEVIDKYGFGVSIVTKSDLILRDIDLLKSINNNAKAVVCMSLSTVDDKLSSILEPGAPLASRRLEALSVLKANNIPTIVKFVPVLPFIEDTEENVRAVVRMSSKYGVYGILNYAMGLTLRNSDREYFYKNLDYNFPGIKGKYINNFGSEINLISHQNNKLREIFFDECNKEGIESDISLIDKFIKTMNEKEYQQLSLF